MLGIEARYKTTELRTYIIRFPGDGLDRENIHDIHGFRFMIIQPEYEKECRWIRASMRDWIEGERGEEIKTLLSARS